MSSRPPLHIAITYQPRSMTSFNQLLHGEASQVSEALHRCDPEMIDKSELLAALTNAFRRIDELQRRVNEISSGFASENDNSMTNNNQMLAAYQQRANSRFKRLDELEKRIDFDSSSWNYTSEGEEWQRLMKEQSADEAASGL